MDTAAFWKTLESARSRSGEFLANLETELQSLKPDELVGFQDALESRMGESYLAALWDVAERMNGGASEEGFDHFRAWLIAQGQEVFERALRDHDSLASLGIKRGAAKLEDLLFVAGSVYADKTGRGDFFDRITREARELEGVRCVNAREFTARFPVTAQTYP